MVFGYIINVKMFINYSPCLLILFILLLIRPYIYGLLIPKGNYEVVFREISNNEIVTKKYVLGRIIYQNPYRFDEELVISIDDKKINKGDYVINENGMIGVIKSKYQNKAIVQLMTSKNMYMQVIVNDCYGILKNDGLMYVTNIDAHCNVKTNDWVYTSNLGYSDELFATGQVERVIKDPNEVADTLIIRYVNNQLMPRTVVVIPSL